MFSKKDIVAGWMGEYNNILRDDLKRTSQILDRIILKMIRSEYGVSLKKLLYFLYFI